MKIFSNSKRICKDFMERKIHNSKIRKKNQKVFFNIGFNKIFWWISSEDFYLKKMVWEYFQYDSKKSDPLQIEKTPHWIFQNKRKDKKFSLWLWDWNFSICIFSARILRVFFFQVILLRRRIKHNKFFQM